MLTGLHLGEGGICPPCQNFIPLEICKGYVRYENKTSDAPPQTFQPSTFALSTIFLHVHVNELLCLHVERCYWLYTALFTNLSVNYAILLVCLTCVIPTLKHDLTC